MAYAVPDGEELFAIMAAPAIEEALKADPVPLCWMETTSSEVVSVNTVLLVIDCTSRPASGPEFLLTSEDRARTKEDAGFPPRVSASAAFNA